MSAVQLTELRTEYELLKDDISDVGVALFVSWCNRVMNFVWRKLRASDPERFITSQNYTPSTAVYSEALPTAFGKMDILGCGFFLLDGSGNATTTQLAKTGPGSAQIGYYLDGGNIVFTNAQDNTYVFRFIPKQPKFTAMSDYFTLDKTDTGTIIIDDEFMEYLIDAIDIKYDQWDEDVVSEGNADQRFANVLSELMEEFDRDSQSISIQTPYNAY